MADQQHDWMADEFDPPRGPEITDIFIKRVGCLQLKQTPRKGFYTDVSPEDAKAIDKTAADLMAMLNEEKREKAAATQDADK